MICFWQWLEVILDSFWDGSTPMDLPADRNNGWWF